MATFQELQQEIAAKAAQVQSQRQAAQDAERARLEAEQAPRRLAAQAEQELQALQRQAAELKNRELADAYGKALVNLRAETDAMFAAVLQANFDEARNLLRRWVISQQQADTLRSSATAQLLPWIQTEWNRAHDAAANGVRGIHERTMMANDAVAHYERFNPEPVPVFYQLMNAWINAVPEGFSRQERRGLCFAAFGLLGQIFDPVFDIILNAPLHRI